MASPKHYSARQKSVLLKKLTTDIQTLQAMVKKSDEKIDQLNQLQTDRLFNLNSIGQLSSQEQDVLKLGQFDVFTSYQHFVKAQECFDFICGQRDSIVSLHNKVVRGHKLLQETREAKDLNQKFQ